MNGNRWLRLTAMIALVVALGGVPIVMNSSSAQSEQTYLALGDSIAAGLTSSLPSERSYPAILRDLMEAERLSSDTPGAVQLVNVSVPGETVQSFIEGGQLESAVEQIDNDDNNLRTITLTLGGNDMLALWDAPVNEREAELDRFQDAFQQVVQEISDAVDGADVDVVVTTYYDLTEGDPETSGSDSWWLAQFNQVIEEAALDAGFDVVDLEDLFRGEISTLTWFPADIHPNNAGHEIVARAIWQQLRYDQGEPTVEITRPEAGEARSRVPTIHATVDDNVGVEDVELVVNGEPAGELLYKSDRDAWIGIWDGRTQSGSEFELSVIATDLAGNEASTSVSISLPVR